MSTDNLDLDRTMGGTHNHSACCVRKAMAVVSIPPVNVLLTVLQHSADQSSEPVGHRRNGFRSTELGA